MFGKREDNRRQGKIDSLVGSGTVIEGNIHFTGGLRIDGEVKGDVTSASGASSSVLVLSEKARVEGAVNVAHLILNGSIIGQVSVAELIEMQSKAKIVGDVEYGVIEMHQGAVIEGRLQLIKDKTVELKLAASN
jgi:cytoskeletal protein CcmA (bactofilin family)